MKVNSGSAVQHLQGHEDGQVVELQPIRVLLVEDNRGDARLIGETLAGVRSAQFELAHVERLTEALERLRQERFDVILLDLLLPDSQGLDTLVRAHAEAQGVPIIVVTAVDDDPLALKALQSGAQDYLIKGQMEARLLDRAIRYAIERKRAEETLARQAQELARSNVELAHSNAELQQFADLASHDLQEPLRMVAGYTQLLAKRYKGKLDADADEFIAYAVDGATRMQKLIDGLLTYSRVGTRGIESELADCEAIFERTLADMRATIEENGAVVTHGPLPPVMADDVQMGQLLQNLIGNAIKFHSDQPPHVYVSAERSRDEWGLLRAR